MIERACVFCAMARGDEPAQIIVSNDVGFVIPALEPRAKVHLLVLPRRHLASVDALGPADRDLWGALLDLTREAVRRVDVDVDEVGYQIVTNAGRHASRAYPHLHLHVLGGTLFKL